MTATVKLLRLVRISAAPLILVAWVASGAMAARIVTEFLNATSGIGTLFVWAVAIGFGLSGILVLSVVADRIGFELRGYRVRQSGPKGYFKWTLGPKDCRYEERTPTGRIQFLPFVREILGDGYPAPSRVHLPSEAEWDDRVPQWARGRRAEIVKRISEALPNAEIAAIHG